MSQFISDHFVVTWEFPQDTTTAKRQGRGFVRALLANGASPMVGPPRFGRRGVALVQSGNAVNARKRIDALKAALPADAQMKILCLTEAQLRRQENFWGKRRRNATAEVGPGI